MTAPAPGEAFLIPYTQLPAALSPFFRVHAPHLDGVECKLSTCDEGLLIEPVEPPAREDRS